MPRKARPWHALSVSATPSPCHRPRKGIDTVALQSQPPCLVFLSPIAAPGFRDELKGSGLGLGLTPRTHPIGMPALSAVHVCTSLHLIDAVPRRAWREPTHRRIPVSGTSQEFERTQSAARAAAERDR